MINKEKIIGMAWKIPLAAVCVGSLLLALPTVTENIDDPNMVVYFNADEGGLMDSTWQYYSGEKRNSYQWDFDYGLEMIYLAGLARLIPSSVIAFKPTTFLLILRFIHVLAWILAILALWNLVGRHFGKGWQQVLAVLLLGTRPAFSYFTICLKPEPLVLLFMIVGLDYTLRIIETPSGKNLLIATVCASIAFIVKQAGVFLLPMIIAAMYFADRRQGAGYRRDKNFFIASKISWIAPALVGAVIISALCIILSAYVRISTGSSWWAQYGFWGALTRIKGGFFIFALGVIFIILSAALLLVNRSGRLRHNNVISFINKAGACVLIVSVMFAVSVLVIGFRWIIDPKHFAISYTWVGTGISESISTALSGEGGLAYRFFLNLTQKIGMLDPVIFLLFLWYLVSEIRQGRRAHPHSILRLKRYSLIVFLALPLIYISSTLLIYQHHMLPFFTAMSILAIQGMDIYLTDHKRDVFLKNAGIWLFALLLIADILFNGLIMTMTFIERSYRREDIAFDAKEWFEKNIPKDASIVSDHYIKIYLSDEYKNVNVLDWNEQDSIQRLKEMVLSYHPQFVYYNNFGMSHEPFMEKISPDVKAQLLKTFSGADRRWRRSKEYEFFVYKLSYRNK